MDEVREKMKNFLINANASGIELNNFLATHRPGMVVTVPVRGADGNVTVEPLAKFVTLRLLPHGITITTTIRRQLRKRLASPQAAISTLLLALLLAIATVAIVGGGRSQRLLHQLSSFANEDCIVTMPAELQKAFRPPEDCSFCTSVRTVPRLARVNPDDFAADYAYTGRPVIVTDATANWTALDRFDYWFFKRLYETYGSGPRAESCQFFPYQTGLRNIQQALSLPPARVRYEPGTEPWYFGWSNCDPAIVRVLREHYGRPYFLPPDSENNAIDWVFMGGPGLGAHMHVDNVRLPSWQSQLKGAKEWILAPPPECLYQCEFLSVVVQTGETIVLDTNKWYHKTNVLPGPISITVGAEYD